jgi:hypothetical protein
VAFSEDKSSLQIWATSVIFKKLPKENNRPIGNYSPNLVTLGKEHLVKKSADLHPRQGNLLQRNNSSVFYKTSLHFTK